MWRRVSRGRTADEKTERYSADLTTSGGVDVASVADGYPARAQPRASILR